MSEVRKVQACTEEWTLPEGHTSTRLEVPPGFKGCENRALSMKYIDEILREDLNIKEPETVYDIEPRIREKGQNVLCPRDRVLGAAYVDVADDEYAGKANLMLSYGWGYTLEDIISALKRYCLMHNWPFHETFVWICCFCVNQHRVIAAKAKGEVVSFDTFRGIFSQRVRDAGRVVGLLSPWKKPLYVERVWCLFEAWEATRLPDSKITMDFVLPESEAKDYMEKLQTDGMKEVYKVLEKIDVRQGQASVPEDREAILNLIEEEGGHAKLNKKIQSMLQTWFVTTASSSEQLTVAEHFNPKFGLKVADLLTKLGQNRECKEVVEKMLDLYKHTDKDTVEDEAGLQLCLARNLGNVGDQKASLMWLEKANELAVQARKDDKPTSLEADILRTEGACYRKLGDLKKSFECYTKALNVYEVNHGSLNKDSGWILLNLGMVRALLDESEGRETIPTGALSAQEYYQRSWTVYVHEEQTGGLAAAWLLRNRGDCFLQEGNEEKAEKDYCDSLKIFRKHNQETVENYGMLCQSRGNLALKRKQYEEATEHYEEALLVLRRQLSSKEALAATLLNLSTLYSMREETVPCQATFNRALDIDKEKIEASLQRLQKTAAGAMNVQKTEDEDVWVKIKDSLKAFHFVHSTAQGEVVGWTVLKTLLSDLGVDFNSDESSLFDLLHKEDIVVEDIMSSDPVCKWIKLDEFLLFLKRSM